MNDDMRVMHRRFLREVECTDVRGEIGEFRRKSQK